MDTPPDRSLSRYALLPLRLFLGATFIYAGLDKLADPHYLAGVGDPASMAAQAHAVAAHSPIGALLDQAVNSPTPAGLAMAFGELAVGFGTLLGLWGRLAALGGALINLTLWLSVSWGVHPYYLGNDLIYLMAWVPLVLAGTPQFSLDELIARRARGTAAGRGRRQILVDGGIATLAVAGAALLTGAGVARSRGRATVPSEGGGAGAGAGAGVGATDANGTAIAAASVPVGGVLRVSAPGSGDPVYLQQPKAGQYTALSGVCTHSGCTVNPPEAGRFVCPCHNSCFDAATGAVLQGPATKALARFGITRSGDQLHLGAETT